jgi:hypothetical protein
MISRKQNPKTKPYLILRPRDTVVTVDLGVTRHTETDIENINLLPIQKRGKT